MRAKQVLKLKKRKTKLLHVLSVLKDLKLPGVTTQEPERLHRLVKTGGAVKVISPKEMQEEKEEQKKFKDAIERILE